MEKFALLNLLKAIDGLQKNDGAKDTPPAPSPSPAPTATPDKNAELPNFMMEALIRHEAMSNRLKNKK